MSRLVDLLVQLAPNGVEYKPLGEIGTLVRGNGMPKSDFSESGVGCIHYGQIYMHYGAWATETISFVAAEKATRLVKVEPGDLVITNTSENLNDVCKAVAWLGSAPVVTGGHASVFKHGQDPKFLSYYLQTPQFFAAKRAHAAGTKVIEVSAGNLARIRVPVPPREVQAEVVRILDQFQELEAKLEAELEAELEARRRQYAHYRDALVASVQARADWRPLGELGEFIRGRRFTKSDYASSGIPSIHYGEIYTDYGTATIETTSRVRPELRGSLRLARHGDLVIAATGENVKDVAKAVAWLGLDEVAVHDDCYIFRHALDPRFASYAFQTSSFHGQKVRYVSESKVVRLSSGSLAKIEIPVPPLEEQRRIASILDSFEALVNDLSGGLPAEIAARRQQYEHYRDRLLTFKEARA